MAYADLQNEEANYQFTVEEEKGNINIKSLEA